MPSTSVAAVRIGAATVAAVVLIAAAAIRLAIFVHIMAAAIRLIAGAVFRTPGHHLVAVGSNILTSRRVWVNRPG